MCYLIRERQAAPEERGGATTPPSFDRLRPRWIGAVAAALIGGLAVAALVAPASTSPRLHTKDSAPAAPLAARAVTVPAAPVVEQDSAPGDGVSSASYAKARMGGACPQDL
jgi:hypothetical protein